MPHGVGTKRALEDPTSASGTVAATKNRRWPVWCWAILLHVVAQMAVVGFLYRRETAEETRRTVLVNRDGELQRIADPATASNELRRRLLQTLKVAGPYVAITVDGDEVHAIPVATPWVVRCDPFGGIAVAFSPAGTDPSNKLEMRLSNVRPNKEQCLDIALSTARLLQTILDGP
jgi:hypothetical protein